MNWIDLSPAWSFLHRVADERDQQKRKFASSRYWNNDSHFVGLIGECVVALIADLEIDWALKINGDGGKDFDGVDVKTSTFLSDPHLKHPVNPKFWPEWFVLVAADLHNQRARLCGHASAQQIKLGEIQNYGYGDQYTLREQELLPGLPDSLT